MTTSNNQNTPPDNQSKIEAAELIEALDREFLLGSNLGDANTAETLGSTVTEKDFVWAHFIENAGEPIPENLKRAVIAATAKITTYAGLLIDLQGELVCKYSHYPDFLGDHSLATLVLINLYNLQKESGVNFAVDGELLYMPSDEQALLVQCYKEELQRSAFKNLLVFFQANNGGVEVCLLNKNLAHPIYISIEHPNCIVCRYSDETQTLTLAIETFYPGEEITEYDLSNLVSLEGTYPEQVVGHVLVQGFINTPSREYSVTNTYNPKDAGDLDGDDPNDEYA